MTTPAVHKFPTMIARETVFAAAAVVVVVLAAAAAVVVVDANPSMAVAWTN
eukprot:CAMPEP_0202462100 /NCGR_PEP_ID=MMETSP1360-20130828/52500_1 /ASSEMBLY_ACC=CAM_ASM_000848 /TAXON_ID=515479 /ORGANISM="Licmophora paradoxa, Strain CCMP2313" /LENGTH=50 /DNA_ID=CAMNT_0049084431 /DNA_START=133 /DNA_END=285 /DNA_ORIENTATION=+